MAKTEGVQSVPSALLDAYRATLGEQRPDNSVEKRYPYRLPTMQGGKSNETAAQRIQRDRFKIAITDFEKVSPAERARWYAGMPPWSSLLWYYNYFIMSSLMGNANITDGGAGVIKSIQFIKEEVPMTGGKSYAINTVDPAKTVVMMFGNSFISDLVQRGFDTIADGGTNNHALSPNVNLALAEVRINGYGGHEEIAEGTGDGDWAQPYVSALIPSQLSVSLIASAALNFSVGYSWEIIERKAQTIFPVITSIAAEAVVIDWAKVPSVVADVSIIVIEYI